MKKYQLLNKMIDLIAKRQSFRVSATAEDVYENKIIKNFFLAEFHISEEVVTILAETNDANGNEFCATELFDVQRALRVINAAIDATSRYEFDDDEDIFRVKKINCELHAKADDVSFAPQMTQQEIFCEYFCKF